MRLCLNPWEGTCWHPRECPHSLGDGPSSLLCEGFTHPPGKHLKKRGRDPVVPSVPCEKQKGGQHGAGGGESAETREKANKLSQRSSPAVGPHYGDWSLLHGLAPSAPSCPQHLGSSLSPLFPSPPPCSHPVAHGDPNKAHRCCRSRCPRCAPQGLQTNSVSCCLGGTQPCSLVHSGVLQVSLLSARLPLSLSGWGAGISLQLQ